MLGDPSITSAEHTFIKVDEGGMYAVGSSFIRNLDELG